VSPVLFATVRDQPLLGDDLAKIVTVSSVNFITVEAASLYPAVRK
jgi:hypothetical protein